MSDKTFHRIVRLAALVAAASAAGAGAAGAHVATVALSSLASGLWMWVTEKPRNGNSDPPRRA